MQPAALPPHLEKWECDRDAKGSDLSRSFSSVPGGEWRISVVTGGETVKPSEREYFLLKQEMPTNYFVGISETGGSCRIVLLAKDTFGEFIGSKKPSLKDLLKKHGIGLLQVQRDEMKLSLQVHEAFEKRIGFCKSYQLCGWEGRELYPSSLLSLTYLAKKEYSALIRNFKQSNQEKRNSKELVAPKEEATPTAPSRKCGCILL